MCKFSKPDTSPNSIEPSTTVLSPYLKFGCLSSRLMYHRLHNVKWNFLLGTFGFNRFIFLKVIDGRKHTSPPTSLTGQLLWREFYYTCGAYIPNFDRMIGNPVCKQIPWKIDPEDEHFVAWKNVSHSLSYSWNFLAWNSLEFSAGQNWISFYWCHHDSIKKWRMDSSFGSSRRYVVYECVNRTCTLLYIHAYVVTVACFLTRGDLWVTWELGQQVKFKFYSTLSFILLSYLHNAFYFFKRFLRNCCLMQTGHWTLEIGCGSLLQLFSTAIFEFIVQ